MLFIRCLFGLLLTAVVIAEGVMLYESFLRDGQKVSDEDAQHLTTQGSKMVTEMRKKKDTEMF